MNLSLEEQVQAVWPKAVCIKQIAPGSGYLVKPDRRSVTILGRGKSRSAAWDDAAERLRKPAEQLHAPGDPSEWMPEAPDMVNHPPHYQSENGIECIDAIQAALTPEEFRGYCKGNALKYAWRERGKGGDEDLKKAAWYLNRLTKP